MRMPAMSPPERPELLAWGLLPLSVATPPSVGLGFADVVTSVAAPACQARSFTACCKSLGHPPAPQSSLQSLSCGI